MSWNIKKYIPEQVKKCWFWIFLVSVLISSYILKTNLSPPVKIITLFALIGVNIVYNIKVKYDQGVTILNWVVTANLILISFAFLFASFKDYNGAAIFILLFIGVVLMAVILSYVNYIWKAKDSLHKKPILKIIIIIILYALIAGHLILFFSFLLSIAQPFTGNQVTDIISNTTISGTKELYYYSAGVFYSSSFGDMVPYGASRWITIVIAFTSYLVHIILLGLILNSFKNESSKKK
ncbi:hypothetical protein COV13_03120 [Candidatus Woesearchaeota archaeon CG10_big_fil_rev_8_21_14_0_10_32_9]|nr:MAG: hypothetical protein COV13_03120 [Candidatus Woesearchaeota archaeon CG10_big_fil_rev_8_21_14_0_10_32_9]